MRHDGLSEFKIDLYPAVTRIRKKWPHTFILGADDPEMTEIENILVTHGQPFQYAMSDGSRVHPGNAYKADPVPVEAGFKAVLVECEPEKFTGFNALPRIVDHHRPGDPGFNLVPELYWEASSLGQIYKLLNLGTPTSAHLALAALDHCMSHARQGKCPGVDPDMVKLLSRQQIAKRKKVSLEIVEACIAEMRRQLEVSPVALIGKQVVVDFMWMRISVGYSLEYLCILEALADTGMAAIIRTKNKASNPDKVILCGAATVQTLEYFISSWAPANGLTKIYGVPQRGYAGGYLE